VAVRTHRQQMGITHPEFFRLVAVALGTDDYEETPDGVTWANGARSGRITLGPEGTRQIALLAIPTTPVTIELNGYDDAAAEAFMQRFDRAYQRGGG